METKVAKKSKGHKCYLCGYRFDTIHILRKHVNVHRERDLECDLCGNLFSTKWGLKKHMRIHTGERPFKCMFCEQRFRQKTVLTSHIANIHENRNSPYARCKICAKRIKSGSSEYCWLCTYIGRPYRFGDKSNSESTEHQDIATKDGNHSKVTSSTLSHIIVEHLCHMCETPLQSGDQIYCEVCSAKEKPHNVANSSDFESDNAVEISNQKLIGEEISSEGLVDVNADPTDSHPRPSCLQCMIQFPNLVALREHTAKEHKRNWNFSCGICSIKFATPEARNHHMETHEEYRPFKCLVCSRSFKSQLGLNNHLQSHRPDRPFSCVKCDESFKTAIALKSHTIVHQKERPFVCKECGFGFKSVYLLKKHMIVHTGEKPYTCDKCGKLFRYPGNLGRHYFLHTKQRLFVCPICGKDFAQSCGLKQHEQVHNKNWDSDKALTCTICGKAYKMLRQLRKHLTTHRSNVDDHANLYVHQENTDITENIV